MFTSVGTLRWRRLSFAPTMPQSWSQESHGMPAFRGAPQSTGVTCWAASIAASREALGFGDFNTEELVARWYKSKSLCPGNVPGSEIGWEQSISDLECALVFCEIWVETHEPPDYLTADRLEQALASERGVVCGLNYTKMDDHVVVYYLMGRESPDAPWVYHRWDPFGNLTDSLYDLKECAGMPSFVVGR